MRLPVLDKSELSPRQVELYDRIAGKRGHVRGPFAVWLHSPELCDKVEALGAFVRFDCVLPERIRELSILICARYFDAPYSWAAHADKAVAAGVDAQAVTDLAEGREPTYKNDDETAFHNFAMELLKNHYVSDEIYAAAHKHFGDQGMVDAIGCIGNFSMLAMCLNTFEVPLRDGIEPPFPDVRDCKKVPVAG